MQDDIQEVLNQYIRPKLQADGGDVVILDFKEEKKYLRLRLMGQCCTCPHSSNTIENIIKTTLESKFKNIEIIVVETGLSEEMLELAKTYLKGEKN